jgi:uncharacterized protein YjbI with pentapeptide repeats
MNRKNLSAEGKTYLPLKKIGLYSLMLVLIIMTISSLIYFIQWEISLRNGLYELQVNLQKDLQNGGISKRGEDNELQDASLSLLNEKYLELEASRINASNSVRNTFVTALGGLFFVATAYFSWENLVIAKKVQSAEKFNKAVEFLTNDNPLFHFSGIYLLEELAEEREKDYPVMEMLSAYLLDNALYESESSEQVNDSSKKPQGLYVKKVEKILNILAKSRYVNSTEKMPDLSGLYLKEVQLGSQKGYDFSNTLFSGANLEGANLMFTNLRGSVFVRTILKNAVIVKANLQGATLKEAVLVKARLKEADLKGARLVSADLREANLKGANLKGANFSNANLLGAQFEDTDLSQAEGLTSEQISQMVKNEKTILPDYLK